MTDSFEVFLHKREPFQQKPLGVAYLTDDLSYASLRREFGSSLCYLNKLLLEISDRFPLGESIALARCRFARGAEAECCRKQPDRFLGGITNLNKSSSHLALIELNNYKLLK